MKKFMWIYSNPNSINDGVGKYGYLLCQELRKMGYLVSENTGYTEDKLGIKKITSMEMVKALKKSIKQIINEKYDYVCLEYPFKEYNPLFLIYYFILVLVTKRTNTKVILSLHEYFRAKKIRRMIMFIMAMTCNIIFTTEIAIQEHFEDKGKKIYIRSIPSFIQVNWNINEKKVDNNTFIYFGLVISNKAFDEMLKAWEIFNKNGIYKLKIVTSSNIELDKSYLSKYNVELLLNKNDEEVSDLLKNSTYAILPVKPKVGYYNSTLKSTSLAGCLLVGCFDENIFDNNFMINISNYELDNFVKGLMDVVKLNDNRFVDRTKQSINFGKKYSVRRTCEEIIEGICKYEKNTSVNA